MEEKPSPATKTIRLTRTEAYAMKLAKPRKKPMKLLGAGLLLILILGSVLWLLQDWWLPYWLPESKDAEAPSAESAAPAAESAPQPAEPAAAPAPSTSSAGSLDYLSAATWDHPDFIQGVRTFNRSIDQLRQYQRNSGPPALLDAVENGALEAARLFDGLRASAPPSVPLAEYIAQAHRLVVATRQAGKTPAPASAPAAAKAPALTRQEFQSLPAYQEGARLFNQALEQYNQYKATPSRKELLKPTEEMARQAGEQFETLKRQVPDSLRDELDRQIHKCYGIVSACRGEQLKSSGTSSSTTFGRSTTGPNRRPALPAYQPPQ